MTSVYAAEPAQTRVGGHFFYILDLLEKNVYYSNVICNHMPLSEDERRSYLLGMKIMGDFGAAIAVPVVAFVLVGKWLQTKYGFEPFGIIGGFLFAIVMSTITIRKKVKWYAAEYAALKTPESLTKKK